MFNKQKETIQLKAFDVKPDTNSQSTEKESNTSKQSKAFISFAILLVLIILGLTVYHFTRDKNNAISSSSQDVTMFVPIDEITVNLKNTSESNGGWLRIKVTLEVNGKSNYDIVSKMTPKVIDIFQAYLKELRRSDLDGSFGIYKIKDEMMMRINNVLYPAKIDNILFQEILIQTL